MLCAPTKINGEKLHKFACVLGECDECKDRYKPFSYEAECVEYIKYCLYDGHHQCTWHGDKYIEKYQDEKDVWKHRCTKCNEMLAEEVEKWLKQKKAAKVNTKKYKTKYAEALQDFVKVNGVYHDLIKNYRKHRFH